MARILVDMDEVVTDSLSKWISILKRRFRFKVPQAFDTSKIRAQDVPWEAWGLNWQQYRSPILEPGFYRSLEPIPHAIEKINQLSNRRHEIFFVTTPPKGNATAGYEKELWIQEHFPSFSDDCVILTRRKDLIKGDVLVDDKPSNLTPFDGIRICFDQAQAYKYDHPIMIDGDNLFDRWVTNPEEMFNAIIEELLYKREERI
jgi:5'(3')-deoxyribonucleotidase